MKRKALIFTLLLVISIIIILSYSLYNKHKEEEKKIYISFVVQLSTSLGLLSLSGLHELDSDMNLLKYHFLDEDLTLQVNRDSLFYEIKKLTNKIKILRDTYTNSSPTNYYGWIMQLEGVLSICNEFINRYDSGKQLISSDQQPNPKPAKVFCPNCGGNGKIRKIHYIPDRHENKKRVVENNICTWCNGKGVRR